MKDYAPLDFRHIVIWPIAIWQIVIASQNPDPKANYFKGATTLNITTRSLGTLSILVLFVAPTIASFCIECRYAEFRVFIVMLNVIILSIDMLSVLALLNLIGLILNLV